MKYFLFFIVLGSFLFGCQQEPTSTTNEEDSTASEVVAIPPFLPLQTVAFDDFSAFQTPDTNWKIVDKASSDFMQNYALEIVDGKGILVNKPDSIHKGNLVTLLEHGDLELELEFMMARASNSGIYFQSRYEVQLFDSWNKDTISFADCGGIYEQWKDKENGGTIGGATPKVNASKAPGLWQTLRVLFRAPRFDATGKKTANAKFEYVYLNDMLIQKNVEVSSPTIAATFRDEKPKGNLMIQGDHGPVAFRNMRLKTLAQDTVTLNNLTYKLYNGKWDYIPNFDTMQVTSSGSFNSFADVENLAQTKDHFAFVFEGNMEIPNEGQYLFETTIDDGGDLYIDDKLVVHNEGDPGLGTERAIVNLTKGVHKFKLTYYEEVWLAWLVVQVEGPNVEKHYLLNPPGKFPWGEEEVTPITVTPNQTPEMVRAFVMHGKEKKTHTISVGTPNGIHFSYDLQNAALLSAWKGKFADVTEMWDGRGESQLLKPLNARIELDDKITLASLAYQKDNFPAIKQAQFQSLGYTLNVQQFPVFEYRFGNVNVRDEIVPKEKQLQRTLVFDGQEVNLYHKVAVAKQITKLANGWYDIDGNYYVQVNQPDRVELRTTNQQQTLMLPVANKAKDTLSYNIVW